MGCGVSRHVVVDETMSSRKLQLEMDNKEGCINETSTEINNLLEKLKEKDKLIEELQRGAVTQINSLQDEKEEVAQEVSRPIIIDGGVDESVRTVTEITEQTDGLDNKAETYELEDQFQNTQNVQQQESEQCSEEELSEIHRLNKCIRELKERVLCLEYQQLVLKQIKNAKKLRELEELPHKPVEFEDIICKIKEDAATIAEDLKKRDAFERQAATLSSETNIALSFTGQFTFPSLFVLNLL
jgi:hypothetical protein